MSTNIYKCKFWDDTKIGEMIDAELIIDHTSCTIAWKIDCKVHWVTTWSQLLQLHRLILKDMPAFFARPVFVVDERADRVKLGEEEGEEGEEGESSFGDSPPW